MKNSRNKSQQGSRTGGLLPLAAACLFGGMAVAQRSTTPAATQMAPAATAQTAPAAATQRAADRNYTNAEIAQRPYNAIYTAPQYPSTRPVQKQFSVTYRYNYAQSQYTPPVPVPLVSKAAQSFTTPENAVIALMSAAQRGSYDDWLACWDTPSQAAFRARETASPQFRGKMLEQFKLQAAYRLVLVDRVDTVNYVVLDVTQDDPRSPMHGQPFPVVTVFDHGRWVVSDQFGGDPLVARQAYPAEGDQVTRTFDLRPEDKGTAAVNRAQQMFLNRHTQSSQTSVTAE